MTTPPVPTRALAADIDRVKFGVIRNTLLAITEEMVATLRRAAYSTNIKTRGAAGEKDRLGLDHLRRKRVNGARGRNAR